jgi:WD40 repeat protein/serine/threonine protein kinase
MSRDSDDRRDEDSLETITAIPQQAARRRVHEADTVPAGPDVQPTVSQAIAKLPSVSRTNYDIGGEIARGGLGRIMEARDRRLDRVVAIKELMLDDRYALARFAREAMITAKLQHPGIVPVHEAGRWEDGQPFYAMKYVQGAPLHRVIERAETFEDRLGLVSHVVAVAEAMAYAHDRRIIHRDLKPANVLVGPFGETVVIDWGLAKDLSEPDDELADTPSRPSGSLHYETSDGAVVGTPAFMPPEQAEGVAVDERADVYSLGALLYTVLAGERPFANVSNFDLLASIRSGPPQALVELVPDTPRDLLAIVAKAMAREPKDRYPSAKELAEELTAFTTGNIVGAHRYSSWELLSRFYQRRRGVILTASIALLAIVAGGVYSYVNISQQRNRAEDSAASEMRVRKAAEKSAIVAKNAEAEATERLHLMILERARSLLDTDPTASIAWLKALPDPSIAGTASIAADAQDRGVARFVLRDHTTRLWATAFSPDGSNVVTTSESGEVLVWQADTGTARVFAGHTDRVPTAAFSPDGAYLATGSYDETVRVWNVSDGTVAHTLEDHGADVKRVAYSKDGKRLASIGADGAIIVWNTADWKATRRNEQTTRDAMLEFSPGGRFLATGSHADTVFVWDLDDASKPTRKLAGHAGTATALSFSNAAGILATGDADGVLHLWTEGLGTHRELRGHASHVRAIAFSADDKQVATGGQDGEVRLWDPATGEGYALGTHGQRITDIVFTPDGTSVITAGWDKTIRVWSTDSRSVRTLYGHNDVVQALALSPDGRALASVSWDTTARLWPLDPSPRRVMKGHTIGVKTVAFSPDGIHIASGAHDNTVRMWNADTGTGRTLGTHADHVFRVAFSPDGNTIASSSDDKTVRLWDIGASAYKALAKHTADVEEIAFTPDGTHVVSGAEDNTARVWNTATGEDRLLDGHTDHITEIAIASAGDSVATASRDSTIRIWAIGGEDVRVLRGHDGAVLGLDFSPDASELASTGDDGTLRVWSVATGESRTIATDLEGARTVRFSSDAAWLAVAGRGHDVWLCKLADETCEANSGHEGSIERIAFSPDGAALASASADGTVRIWDVATSESRVLRGHTATVFDVAFSPDGARLVSGSGDGDVAVWLRRMPPSPDGLHDWLGKLTNEPAAELQRTSRQTPTGSK